MEQPSSNLFEGFKSLGHVTGPLPFIVRHGKNSQNSRIITIVGRTFHTYTTNLQLTEVSIPHENNIVSLVSDERHIYSASSRTIFQWAGGGKSLVRKFDNGHQSEVTMMTKLGPNQLLALDNDNNLFNWSTIDCSILNIITFDDALFQITSMCHPLNYNDKCLLGSKQGSLELWNVVSEKCLYKFPGWESAVTCLVQSPVEHVVAIGLEDGHVYVQNIRYDETVLKIYQEYGSITSMSFRLDGRPYLVTASPVGHLMIWDLERKRLASQLRHAHINNISKCQFLRNESQLITSGSDNTLKIWTLDMSDGGGQLMCQRAGHSEPPSQIRFYGPKGLNILSAGLDSTMKMFHVYSERFNRNLGAARMNPKSRSKSSGLAKQRLPPITRFAAECSKEKQWDNIAACHKGSSLVTTWSYDKCCMGEHIITQPTFNKHEVSATSICITSCGNFLVIGFSNGLIFKYNIQSGQFRQYFEHTQLTDHRAHDGQVTGVAVDGLDLVLISAGSNSKLLLWNFKTAVLIKEFETSAAIAMIELHRENNLLAIAMDNNSIEILDIETQIPVRKFTTSGAILDMCFSPDSRWLVVALDDKSIRTWDLSLGKMIDAFRMSSKCTSLSISASGEFLATAHEDSLGINIWGNLTLYCPTALRPVDPSATPPLLDMPFVRDDELFQDDDNEDDDKIDRSFKLAPVESDILVEDVEYESPEQLNTDLITLSGLPSSRWKNLLKVDEMRRKQLIEEEERKDRQIKVPFFIPVKDGLAPRLDVEQLTKENTDRESSTVMNSLTKINELRLLSPLAQSLIECSRQKGGDYSDFFKQLKELGPSATDAEVRSLGKDTCGSTEPMLCFLDAIEANLKSSIDYELASAWLALFLKAHSDIIVADLSLRNRCETLLPRVAASWDKLNGEFNQIFCVLNFVRSSIL